MLIQSHIKKVTATQVRKDFGTVVAMARDCGVVQVARRGKPAAYLESQAVFMSLKGIDDQVALMQKPASIKAMKSLMTIDTKMLREMLGHQG